MKTLTSACRLVVLACAFAPPVYAQSIDPGLWEMESEMQGGPMGAGKGGAQVAAMLKQLENAPPEVRAMLEKQLGISGIGTGDGGGMKMRVRTCLAPEDVKDEAIYEGKSDGECIFTKVNRNGNVWKGTMVCKGEDVNGTGEFVATWHSRSHYSTESVLRSEEMGEMKMRSENRRLSADCGSGGKGGVMGAVRSKGK